MDGNDTNGSASCGFCARVTVDLHKYLAAAKVLACKTSGMVSNEVAEGMKIVASISSTTSARVNLMFRSNNRLKALWTEVLTIGKQALDQNNALKDAETVTSELSKLKDLLLKWDDQNDFKTLDALEEAIRSCSKATALRTVCHASNDSAVTEAGQKLDQSLQAVQGVISTAFQASVCLKDFLETLWTDNLAVPEQQLSIGGKDINVRTFLTYLRVEGRVTFCNLCFCFI